VKKGKHLITLQQNNAVLRRAALTERKQRKKEKASGLSSSQYVLQDLVMRAAMTYQNLPGRYVHLHEYLEVVKYFGLNALLPMLLDMQISRLLTIHSGCSSFIKNPSLQGEHQLP
jgi:hypothetical protein